ncbi:MAG TPA: AI-2E family transporter [bacterium]|nr:AI-2E family transporter [bacterium]HPR88550.1 AI-2E family transporter [bacterium]
MEHDLEKPQEAGRHQNRPGFAHAGRMDFNQYFLLFSLLAVLVLFFLMIKSFMVPIIVAAVFATLFHSMYLRLVRWTRGRKGIAAILACLILLLVLLIPLYVLFNVIINQASSLYDSIGPAIEEFFTSGTFTPEALTRHPLAVKLKLDQIDWQATIKEGITTISAYAGKAINATSRSTFAFLTNLLMIFFTMFYFFRDGEGIVQQIMAFLPLEEEYKRQIITRFDATSRATIKGSVILGAIQGILGGITLWIFGFNAAVMWGMVMVILSLLPMVGAYLILIPAAIYDIAMGNTGSGIAIIVISVVVISNVDNLLRPRLVGRDVGMHDLMVFFSTLGGIGFFGALGFIIGPVVASLLITLLDIYSAEFKRLIKRQKAEDAAAVPQP